MTTTICILGTSRAGAHIAELARARAVLVEQLEPDLVLDGQASGQPPPASLSRADLVLLALDWQPPELHRLVQALGTCCPTSRAIAVCGATLNVNAVGRDSAEARLLVALHPVPPYTTKSPVEIATGLRTEDQTITYVEHLLTEWGVRAQRVTARAGLLVDRITLPLYLEASRLVEEGVPAAAVDTLAQALGFAAGPLETLAALGLEDVESTRLAIFEASGYTASYRAPVLWQTMVDARCSAAETREWLYDHQGK